MFKSDLKEKFPCLISITIVKNQILLHTNIDIFFRKEKKKRDIKVNNHNGSTKRCREAEFVNISRDIIFKSTTKNRENFCFARTSIFFSIASDIFEENENNF